MTTWKDLMRLKDVTRMTGALEKSQMTQLKMWPRVMLCANQAEVEFDPDTRIVSVNLSNIDYESMLKGFTGTPVDAFKLRMSKFDLSVKMLLGDEYSVIVKIKDNVVGEFPSNSINVSAHPPQEEGRYE